MSKISRLILLFALLPLIFQIAACRKKEAPAPAQPVRVSATKAYEHYFGPAPTSGMEVGSYKGEFLVLFPSGTHLLALDEVGGNVTVRFSREMGKAPSDPAGLKALSSALALTLGQFPGVKEVRMQTEGEKGETVCVVLPESDAVIQPGSPRLLNVTAVKEKGEKDAEAVHAYFDRPVEIRELKISDANGKPFEGEVFHSVFDMAAVLKPKEPSLFKAGIPVKVRWKVADRLGRTAEGNEEFSLEVKEH